ncbi:caspase, EACC1-associated type [Catenuloplanes atrovinosus]|uniref:WD40 repeat protein n=1 Tax=Catenuloplanes atrovinosus TaxID=137266 RepID=A0AAE4C9B7_9ACTN|nr:caspase family protein [Catenuloplanes atrovinosus]MDR7276386.1 WD40 repeat protein [Catenuloplanes atrovinosus]
MESTDLSNDGVRVLVIGTATHAGPTLTSVPAAARSAEAVAAALTEAGRIPPASVTLLIDPPTGSAMADAVAEAVASARTALVVYFVGHGLLGPRDELYLAAAGTDRLRPVTAATDALPFQAVQDAVRQVRVPVVIVLDCCYSGRATLPAGVRLAAPGFSPPVADGAYLVASAERLALAPEGAELTAFSRAFVDLLRHGDPRSPRRLTLNRVFERLAERLRADGAPSPRREVRDDAGTLTIALNAAHPAAPAAEDDEPAPSDGPSPYPGLRSFGPGDAALFRGRDRAVAMLLDRCGRALAAGTPLVLVAASGTGKTSLLLAGLLPALRRGDGGEPLAGAAGWPDLVLTPGDHPLDLLVARLRAAADEPDAADGPADPVLLAARARAARGADRMVLVVDQVEQVFTLCDDPAERAAFLAAVAAIAAGGDLVVTALRADFFAAAAEQPELAGALAAHQVLLPAMTAAELREAIEGPAADAGLRLDDGLAETMLTEMGVQGAAPPGAGASARLPLLSHALWATWLGRRGDRLTLAGYRARGGITVAIKNSADEAYDGLAAAERDALRRMLPRLVVIADDGPDTTRPAARDELFQGLPDRAAAERALEVFTAARLVTTDRDTVRLSHEALLTAWPRLHEWLAADRDWLRVRQRLGTDARAWRDSGRDAALLYRGSRLAAVREEGADRAIAGLEAEFVALSHRQQRRGARLRTALIAVLSALLVLAVVAATAAVVFQRRAVERQHSAVARLLAEDAARLAERQPGLAAQLALTAYRLDPEVGSGPVLARQTNPGQLHAGGPVYDLDASTDRRVTAYTTGTGIVLWDPFARARLAELTGLSAAPVAVSGDGRLLAAGTGRPGPAPTLRLDTAPRPEVRVWDLADPRRPRQVAALPAGPTVSSVALSGDGRLLVAAGKDGRVRRWDLAEPAKPEELAPLGPDAGPVDSVAVSPDGRLIAAASAGGPVRLWNPAGPGGVTAPAEITAPPGPEEGFALVVMRRVAFDATGAHLITVAGDEVEQFPRIWRLADPARPEAITERYARTTLNACAKIMSLTPSQNLRFVLAGCDSARLATWRHDPEQAGDDRLRPVGRDDDELSLERAIGAVLILPPAATGGRTVVATAGDLGVVHWDLTDAWQPGAATTLPGPGTLWGTARFSPTLPRLLADASYYGTRLWRLDELARPELVGEVGPLGRGPAPDDYLHTAFRPDGALVAVPRARSDPPRIDLVRTADPAGAPAGTLSLTAGVSGVEFSPDGRLLAVMDRDIEERPPDWPEPPAPRLRIYDVSAPEAPREVLARPVPAARLSFSPDGRRLAVFGDTRVEVWDVTHPDRPAVVSGRDLTPGAPLAAGAFTPDGRTLVVGDASVFIQLVPVDGSGVLGTPTTILTRSKEGTAGLAVSPDGRLLALLGDPLASEVDLWSIADPASPRRIATLDVGTSPHHLSFSHDSRLLAVRTPEAVDVWSLDPEQAAGNLCAAMGEPITAAQWAQHVPDLPYDSPCD